jgi:hypothetical protein
MGLFAFLILAAVSFAALLAHGRRLSAAEHALYAARLDNARLSELLSNAELDIARVRFQADAKSAAFEQSQREVHALSEALSELSARMQAERERTVVRTPRLVTQRLEGV